MSAIIALVRADGTAEPLTEQFADQFLGQARPGDVAPKDDNRKFYGGGG